MKRLFRSSNLMALIGLAALLAMPALLTSDRDKVSARGNGNGHGNGNNAEEFIFGTVGLTPGQTARLNVVNIALNGRPQTRVLKFLDSAGNVIVDESGNPVTKTVTLGPGESSYLDLSGADIPGGASRVQIRALDPQCTTCGRETPRTIIQTLELYDNLTHKTDVLYSPAQFVAPEGPPSRFVPFGMVGIAQGQTARLNVSVPPDPIQPADPVTPGDPMRVLLGFVRADGQPVSPCLDCPPTQMVVMVRPGESASFDLPADLVLTGGESRVQIRPVVLAGETCATCKGLISTLEVMETCSTCTGKTSVLYAPVMRSCGSN